MWKKPKNISPNIAPARRYVVLVVYLAGWQLHLVFLFSVNSACIPTYKHAGNLVLEVENITAYATCVYALP